MRIGSAERLAMTRQREVPPRSKVCDAAKSVLCGCQDLSQGVLTQARAAHLQGQIVAHEGRKLLHVEHQEGRHCGQLRRAQLRRVQLVLKPGQHHNPFV